MSNQFLIKSHKKEEITYFKYIPANVWFSHFHEQQREFYYFKLPNNNVIAYNENGMFLIKGNSLSNYKCYIVHNDVKITLEIS